MLRVNKSVFATRKLFGVGQVVDLGFQGLVVLAFDLQFGLELFDEQFESRDFGAKLLSVAAGYRAGGRVNWRLRWLAGMSVLARMLLRGWEIWRRSGWRRRGARREGFG
jgi:hypothetical protein